MITKYYVRAEIIPASSGQFSIEITDGEGNAKVYRDLTDDIRALSRFVELVNQGNVSYIHIEELIEDFLA